MDSSSKIRVAVLRGGPSHGYEHSLKTGNHVLSMLREMPDTYEPLDIFISKEGEWHYGGLAHEPHQALRDADVAWNAMHGAYGEDGQVQKILQDIGIPFTGSRAAAAALSTDKEKTKNFYNQHGLLTPVYELLTEENFNEDRLIAIFRTYLHPVIVKPADGVHSLGVRLARTYHELKDAVKSAFSHSPKVLVEEYIKGNEASCVVIEKAKGENIYALLPASGSNIRLPMEENKQIEELAKKAHEVLGLRHYSSSDFIITPKKKIYILETNSLPVLHEESLLHQSLTSTGWRSRDFVDHVIKLAVFV